jgi:putative membrane protein
LAVFLVVAALLAIGPNDRGTWVLENALAVALVVMLWITRRVFPFSNVSYTLIFLFLVLHEVGAHFTYSQVPYDAWSEKLFGRSVSDVFGFERNHYDRLVHFLYGFLLAYPMREIFVRVAGAKGFWGYLLPLLMTMASSCLYEIIEWWAALVFGSDVGNAYLGTQGDEFDSQKDMALASLGALLSLAVVFVVHRRLARDFHSEWVASLAIKRRKPLGEQSIAEHRAGP